MAIALTTAVSGCAWYTGLADPTAERSARIGKYTADPANTYMQRFEELQQRIEALERENHRLRSPKSTRKGSQLGAASAIVPHKAPAVDESDSVISQVKLKVSQAVLAIDNILSQLNTAEVAEVVEQPEPVASASMPQDDVPQDNLVASLSPVPAVSDMHGPENRVNGILERDGSGDVVRSTSYLPSSEPKFNFSVVYSYPEVTPWNAMWQILEDANEHDKWRGVNKTKPAYFIYVGAYVSEQDATNRQQNLLTITGQEPDLRKRAINRAIAAN